MAGPEVSVRFANGVCHVSGVLNFSTARQALDRVSPIIEAETQITVDLSEVTGSNSAGLALLIEWLAVARRAGHTLGFRRIHDGLQQLARVCQVDSLL
jgi:phospholipid transport system transporter-binding protein